MNKKNVAPREESKQTAKPQEMTEDQLDQVAGGVSNNPLYTPSSASTNPLYTPLTQGGTNPLYKS
jgi:hypothetical protein